MKVIYLDQNLAVRASECMRQRKSNRLQDQAIRREIERCVADRSAIFPYSEVHLVETANVADPESRSELIKFWKIASKGYRFHPASVIQEHQVEMLLKARPIRFSSHLAIQCAELGFEQELESPNATSKRSRVDSYGRLTSHWAAQPMAEISGKARHNEIQGLIQVITQDLTTFVKTGDLPWNRVFSDHNSVLSVVFWHFHQQGSTSAFEDSLRWIRENALNIPSLFIDFVGTEYLAGEFACDRVKGRKKIEKSELDHDANDLRFAAHFFPYCDAVFTDTKMAETILPRLRKTNRIKSKIFDPKTGRKLVFSSATLFHDFLRTLKPTKQGTSVAAEIKESFCKMLLYIPDEIDLLIARQPIVTARDLYAEILPGGGVRVFTSDPDVSWSLVINEFRRLTDEFDETGGEGQLTAIECNDQPDIVYSDTIRFGVFSSELDQFQDCIRRAASSGPVPVKSFETPKNSTIHADRRSISCSTEDNIGA